jgi:acetylornithine deacetylase/succinyl-diaminopimelate desuccinylase-like protein
VVPTIVKGGFRTNVIPSEAEATVDIRAVPGEDIPKFFEEMRKVINDPAVKMEANTFGKRPETSPSRLDNEMYRQLEAVAKRMYPGTTILPSMSTGATDMAFLRAKGMQCYGIGPASSEEDSTNYGAHSDVERMKESSVYSFVEFMWNAVTGVALSK